MRIFAAATAARPHPNCAKAQSLAVRPGSTRFTCASIFSGGAATAPPPASIAAYFSRAAPPSDDAANTRCRPPRPPRRLMMTARVTPSSPAVAASPLCCLRHLMHENNNNRAQKVRTDFPPQRPAAGRSLSCPFWGGAATAPPPASIAAYCSRAAPPSVADDGPSDAATPRSGGFPLCSVFVTCCVQKILDSKRICMVGLFGERGDGQIAPRKCTPKCTPYVNMKHGT